MTPRKIRAEVYRDRRGAWRYRVIAGNGEIIATGQAYTRRWSAIRGAFRNHPNVTKATVVDARR
jgi:uncharacterized protein YegP (UPF0339 family)